MKLQVQSKTELNVIVDIVVFALSKYFLYSSQNIWNVISFAVLNRA